MPKSRIPSPARSQGVISTPRRHMPRRSRSVCSPTPYAGSARLTSIIDQFKEKNLDSFVLSPVNTRRSVLTDNTDIEEPRRKSWWKNLNENSQDVMEALVDNKATEAVNAIEDIVDVEILSQEKKNYTLDLPESSDNESINSIVIQQRKLFSLKENQPQNKFGQLVSARETLAKLQKTHNDKTINAGTKDLFQAKKRSRPVFPAALLNISPNKTTADKTKENAAAEPKAPIRNIFGSRPANKRKNIFADFIVSESEDEISDIQPKVFGFQYKGDQQKISSMGKARKHSPASSITTDMEQDEWKYLPSSTMVEHQLDEMVAGTPVKRGSKIMETDKSLTVQEDYSEEKGSDNKEVEESDNNKKEDDEDRNVSLKKDVKDNESEDQENNRIQVDGNQNEEAENEDVEGEKNQAIEAEKSQAMENEKRGHIMMTEIDEIHNNVNECEEEGNNDQMESDKSQSVEEDESEAEESQIEEDNECFEKEGGSSKRMENDKSQSVQAEESEGDSDNDEEEDSDNDEEEDEENLSAQEDDEVDQSQEQVNSEDEVDQNNDSENDENENEAVEADKSQDMEAEEREDEHMSEIEDEKEVVEDKGEDAKDKNIKHNNTSIRKTKSMHKDLTIRPSLAPRRDSLGLSDGTRDSSAEGSGWDSHRTTRKTLRQTFGKDFTPRKSLRALVMEKAAKHTAHLETLNNDTVKFPQANSTEYPENLNQVDNVTVESDHELSRRTRQTTLETYLQKIKQQNMEKRTKMEEAIRNSLKAPPPRDPLSLFKMPSKPVRKTKTVTNKSKKSIPNKFQGELPPEIVEDMKYKPPKRFQPSQASWITKRLYKFLERKLEPKYDYKARVRAEKLVETIFYFVKELRRPKVASPDAVEVLKHEMARLDIVKTHFEFYEFFHEFMPREVIVKVNPDIVNNIPLPRHGVFSDIIRRNNE